jgi:AraC-like DNA-binding protein
MKKPAFDSWIFSLPISLTFPPFLYLYSKYVTIDFERFQRKDYLHATPVILTVLLIFLFRNPERKDFYSDITYYAQLTWLRNSIGIIFNLMLWMYGILALRNIMRYKKQIVDIYSYKSDRISLTWLLVVVISFIVVYNIIIITSTLSEMQIIKDDIDPIRDVALLVYVYIVGIWGYRQNQLTSNIKPIKSYKKIINGKRSSTSRYQKSGLKGDQAKDYLQQLIQFMNQTDAWKDSELSITTLSRQTNIPKHHITQVLNEHLDKNFYVFVNEYRIEHAKELIKSPEHHAWSFVAIGYECGFNSKTAFNNFFKKSTGLTPSEYRKLNQ